MFPIINAASKPARLRSKLLVLPYFFLQIRTKTTSEALKARPKQTRKKSLDPTTNLDAKAVQRSGLPFRSRKTTPTTKPAADDLHDVQTPKRRRTAVKDNEPLEVPSPKIRLRTTRKAPKVDAKNGTGLVIVKEKDSVTIRSNRPDKSSLQLPGDPMDHMTKYLDWAVGKHYAGKALGDTSRMNILSGDLCGMTLLDFCHNGS
jgi:hypothetical protein